MTNRTGNIFLWSALITLIIMVIISIILMSGHRNSDSDKVKVQSMPQPIEGMPGCSLYRLQECANCSDLKVVRCVNNSTSTQQSDKAGNTVPLVEELRGNDETGNH